MQQQQTENGWPVKWVVTPDDDANFDLDWASDTLEAAEADLPGFAAGYLEDTGDTVPILTILKIKPCGAFVGAPDVDHFVEANEEAFGWECESGDFPSKAALEELEKEMNALVERWARKHCSEHWTSGESGIIYVRRHEVRGETTFEKWHRLTPDAERRKRLVGTGRLDHEWLPFRHVDGSTRWASGPIFYARHVKVRDTECLTRADEPFHQLVTFDKMIEMFAGWIDD